MLAQPTANQPRHVLRAVVWRTLIFALVWLLLTEGRPGSWGLGAISVASALVASLYLTPPGPGRWSLAGTLVFIGHFLWQSMRGGVQVAAMALRPRMGLAPAQLEIPLRLPPGPAAALLASSLSLLPGSLSVRLEGQTLLLHVLNNRLPTEQEVHDAERRVARMFGLTL